MVAKTEDAGVNAVLENIEVMVASEGGSLELLELNNDTLRVRYTPGVNEECPECVPSHENVEMFMRSALQVHAPHITALTLE
ncbi:MAG: NifU family protein [Chloroflexota bacterium]